MMTSETGDTRGGLSFIEILIVLALIGVMAALAIPHFRRAFDDLKLHNSSGELQMFMNYLQGRSIVEGEVIFLTIDNQKKEYWAQIKDAKDRLKTYPIPEEIKIDSTQKEIFFYPDGSIDKVTIELVNPDNQKISLTTKGVFGGVKLQPQE